MDNKLALDLAVSIVAKINNTVSGRSDDGNEWCIYAYEEEQLKDIIVTFWDAGIEIKYEITDIFVDGNRDECLVIKAI